MNLQASSNRNLLKSNQEKNKKRNNRPHSRIVFFYPGAIERLYAQFLVELVKDLFDKKNRFESLVNLYSVHDSSEFPFGRLLHNLQSDYINGKMLRVLPYFVHRVKDFTDKKAKIEAAKNMMGIKKIDNSEAVQKALDEATRDNVELIKSLQKSTFDRIHRELLSGNKASISYKEMQKFIQERYGATKAKAELIARDQIGKLNGTLTRLKQQELGGRLYVWRTSGDARVRTSHAVLANKVCTWENEGVYANSVKEAMADLWHPRSALGAYEGNPGQDYQCRCSSEMVIDDILRDLEEPQAYSMPIGVYTAKSSR